jgi:hypothetical protein
MRPLILGDEDRADLLFAVRRYQEWNDDENFGKIVDEVERIAEKHAAAQHRQTSTHGLGACTCVKFGAAGNGLWDSSGCGVHGD